MTEMTMRDVIMVALLLVGCDRQASPERAADRFVDLYFVEIDQARARELASGLARQKLDDELQLVKEVRRTVTPDQAKPTIGYERTGLTPMGERARATYDVHIRQGGDESHRRVMLGLERIDGRWTVSNFTVEEGAAPP